MRESLVPFPGVDESLVLDSWPVMEWLKAREPTASKLDELLDAARAERLHLLISTISLGEIYYSSLIVWGEERADEILHDFRALPVEVVHPTQVQTLLAARLKGRFNVAYGDAFAAVLGLEAGAAVASGNPDFLKLRRAGIVIGEWMGR